jgi:YjbE family integral membrane protein
MSPEFLSPAWWSALASIIVIDLVLAGDNAIVIGLAARNVPADKQRVVVLWGTVGAIAVRILLTSVVVWLLKIPGFLTVGGLALIYVAWKLTHGDDDHGPQVAARTSVRGAIQTIVIADAVMGVDNVLAVGGAAHGSLWLVIIGLAISVPIVVWGSTLVLKWVERFPQIMWFGAAVLGWTAAKMIASEPMLGAWFAAAPWGRTLLSVLIVGGLVALPIWRAASPDARAQSLVIAIVIVWLSVFGYIEQRWSDKFDPIDAWEWEHEIIDLVRWIGWIPLALWAHRRAVRAARTA